jgi:hypothetical protein
MNIATYATTSCLLEELTIVKLPDQMVLSAVSPATGEIWVSQILFCKRLFRWLGLAIIFLIPTVAGIFTLLTIWNSKSFSKLVKKVRDESLLMVSLDLCVGRQNCTNHIKFQVLLHAISGGKYF